jgi:hypothetical protein
MEEKQWDWVKRKRHILIIRKFLLLVWDTQPKKLIRPP